jgi:hypothetical protein
LETRVRFVARGAFVRHSQHDELVGGKFMHRHWKLSALWMALAGTCLIRPCFGQSLMTAGEANAHLHTAAEPMVCGEPIPEKGAKAALRLVCLRDTLVIRSMPVDKAIVIGFVGGFVHRDDMRHPEVQFAAFLRETYASQVHAEVFENHDSKHALRRVLQLLNEDGGGVLTSHEKETARIIIYGHSWGASEAVTLASELGRLNIPVALVILVDSVHKPGHYDAVIPPNVRNAVNFYQTKSITQGRSHIRVADPEHTHISGNFRMTYHDRRINCSNYPWLARHLNRGHHEIENDPRVWEGISLLIDSELLEGSSPLEASLPASLQSVR